MKVLYVVNTYPNENNPAAEPFVKAQIDSICKLNVQVDIYNVNGPNSKLNYLKAIHAIRKKVNRESYDIVHGHYVYSGWIAALQDKYPSVVSFMGSDLNGKCHETGFLTHQGKVDLKLSMLLQLYSDGIIVKSQRMQNLLIGKYKTKSIVLPNGVDFNTFIDIPTPEARKKLHLPLDKIFVLFVGNKNSTQKGFHIFKEAVSILNHRDPRFEMLVAYGLPQRQIPFYMNAANVLALPSMKEGSPNVIKEALACNLPVVATDVGDVMQLIKHLPGCEIVDRKPDAFAEAAQRIISRTKPFNGREAIEHLRIERIAERLLGFYSIVIERCKNTTI